MGYQRQIRGDQKAEYIRWISARGNENSRLAREPFLLIYENVTPGLYRHNRILPCYCATCNIFILGGQKGFFSTLCGCSSRPLNQHNLANCSLLFVRFLKVTQWRYSYQFVQDCLRCLPLVQLDYFFWQADMYIWHWWLPWPSSREYFKQHAF